MTKILETESSIRTAALMGYLWALRDTKPVPHYIEVAELLFHLAASGEFE
jgi:hypothetical protein